MVAKDMAGGVAVVVVLMRLNLRIYLPMWWRWVKRSKCPSWIRLNLDSNSNSLRFSEWAPPLRVRML